MCMLYQASWRNENGVEVRERREFFLLKSMSCLSK